MQETANRIRAKKLDTSNSLKLREFFKQNPDLDIKFRALWDALDLYQGRGITYKVNSVLASFPENVTPGGLKTHINTYFIDSEGEVSPSKFVLLRKINPDLSQIILNSTSGFPKEFTLTGICELIRKNIYEFPKCKNCNNLTSWINASKLLDFCSKKCSDNSVLTKSKRQETMIALYGAKSYSQTKEFNIKRKKTIKERYGNENYTNREQIKETWLKIYGVDNPLKDDNIRKKIQITMKENYGVTNYVQHPNFKNKAEQACMEHFGFRSATQSPDIYKKIQKSLFAVKPYKNSNLTHQGSYELYFLELMETKGLLNEVTTPQPVSYILNNQQRIYNPDYQFREQIIEIKSSWTYNRNGTDKELENKNNAKWAAVKNIIVLKSKAEIKQFTQNC